MPSPSPSVSPGPSPPPPRPSAQHASSQPLASSHNALGVEHDVALSLAGVASSPLRPRQIKHLSSPAYESPIRHHRRQPSSTHTVKETLHARSEYTNSQDDGGGAIHRINQYVIQQEIGRGSFGAVHLAVDQHGTEYAVKEFSKSRLRKRAQSHFLRRPHAPRRPGHLAVGGLDMMPITPSSQPSDGAHRRSASELAREESASNPLYFIREEIAIMKKLHHPNLVCLYEVLDDPAEDSLYMVLEMCRKGVIMRVGMNETAQPYEPEACRCWFRDLILGIEYLHAQGVVHRDIKPDNLLLTEDDVLKIVDFGVSEMFEKHSDMTTAKSAGSPAFLPPELCTTHHGSVSGKAADIWSMGVTLYCLCFGRVPFDETGVLELYDAISHHELSLQACNDANLADLLRRVLEKDPAKRIQMQDLREHPWVTHDGSDPLLSYEENTSDLVEPPTEEEVNSAITGDLSKLLVVMKAVKKFKSLLGSKRPPVLETLLGKDTRVVQPPLSLLDEGRRPGPTIQRALAATAGGSAIRAQSEDVYDRRPIEQALAREGVSRAVDVDAIDRPFYERDTSTVQFHTDPSHEPRPNAQHSTPASDLASRSTATSTHTSRSNTSNGPASHLSRSSTGPTVCSPIVLDHPNRQLHADPSAHRAHPDSKPSSHGSGDFSSSNRASNISASPRASEHASPTRGGLKSPLAHRMKPTPLPPLLVRHPASPVSAGDKFNQFASPVPDSGSVDYPTFSPLDGTQEYSLQRGASSQTEYPSPSQPLKHPSQAHDPREDFFYLSIGIGDGPETSGSDSHSPDDASRPQVKSHDEDMPANATHEPPMLFDSPSPLGSGRFDRSTSLFGAMHASTAHERSGGDLKKDEPETAEQHTQSQGLESSNEHMQAMDIERSDSRPIPSNQSYLRAPSPESSGGAGGMAVSESPGATDVDIYARAYNDEVQRIQARQQAAQVFLTRRVEHAHGADKSEQGGHSTGGGSRGWAALRKTVGAANGSGH